jgi:ataxia telangiectasia mutated family protein
LLDAASDDKQDLLASRATVYRECAMFSERQYHATLKSPDGIRWKVYVDRKQKEIEDRSMKLATTPHDLSRKELEQDQVKARKLLQEDTELFRKHNTIRDNFLRQAIDMHSRCLEASDNFDDDSAIRFCSLWFANFDDESASGTVNDALEHIPSRKLVFLAVCHLYVLMRNRTEGLSKHQLTARLATQTSKAQDSLQRLIMRMCREHPFHSLYQVYCLQPDHPNSTTASRRHSGRHFISTQTERGTAATSIFDRLRSNESIEGRVRDVERLCDACLEWAKYPIAKDGRYKKGKGILYKIPDHLSIRKIAQLKVPVTTAPTPLDLTMKYNDCVWMDHYEQSFTTAGGNNLPKVSICHGSDGQKYKQLVRRPQLASSYYATTYFLSVQRGRER